MVCGGRPVVVRDPGFDVSVSLSGGKADELESAASLGLAVPRIHPPSTAAGITNSSAVPDVPDCVGQDPVRADIERILPPLAQPVPGGPGSSADVSDGLVSVCGVEGTEGKSGRFLDLGEESFELFVEAGGGHVAISELGPPPEPGAVCLEPIPGGYENTINVSAMRRSDLDSHRAQGQKAAQK